MLALSGCGSVFSQTMSEATPATLLEDAVRKAVRATTEAHLVCFGAFAVSTVLSELRSGAAPAAMIPADVSVGIASGPGSLVPSLPPSEADDMCSEADYEPGG